MAWLGAALLLAPLGVLFASWSTRDAEILVALIAGVLAVAFTARRPQVALYIATPILMWPSQIYVLTVPLQVPVVLVLLAGALLGTRWWTRPSVVHAALIAAGIAGLIWLSDINPPSALVQVPQATVFNHFFVLVANLALVPIVAAINPPRAALLRALGASGVALCAYISVEGSGATSVVVTRLQIETLNPNSVGHIAALALLVAVGLYLRGSGWRWWLVAAVVPAYTLFYSQSRGAFVVTAVGLLVMWISGRRGASRIFAVLLGVLAVLMTVTSLDSVQQALLASRDQSANETEARVSTLRLSINLIREHPWGGIGYQHFFDYTRKRLGIIIEPHNDWARLAAECGIPCVLLLLWLASRAMRFRIKTPVDTVMRAVLISGLVAWLFTNSMTDLRMSLPTWVLLGAAWATTAFDDPRPLVDAQVPRPGVVQVDDAPGRWRPDDGQAAQVNVLVD